MYSLWSGHDICAKHTTRNDEPTGEMAPKILSGKWLAAQHQSAIRKEVDRVNAARANSTRARPPGLGVILVGENPASLSYVTSKTKIAGECGFATFDSRLPATATQADVRKAIEAFNQNPAIDGILLQLPLPAHLNSHELIDAIDPKKDADGLHPMNQGLLARGEGVLRPCTPMGCMSLIDLAYSDFTGTESAIDVAKIPQMNLAGKNAVVIGRSILVGKPVGLLLLERNATVTMAHSKTADLHLVTRQADIVVAAVGVAHLVKGSWVREGAVVIDVGMNRLPTGKLTGDVDYDGALAAARAITPVPGGVGPMTVTMLVLNTLRSYLKA